jgi:urease accessory protein
MEQDTKRMRGDRPFIFSNLMNGDGVDALVAWVEDQYHNA